MTIKSLVLKNYRRFRELSLEFPENLQGLLGANGAGKSTIVESIAWALYGTRAARGSKREIRSHHCTGQDVCQVCLIFEVGGTEYKVIRTLRGKNAVVEAAIYVAGNNEAIAVQESGVNEVVENAIGLDYRSFFASVFARQKELAALGDMRPEERKQAINRLINIDAIDAARALAQERRSAAENELRGIEKILVDTDVLKAKLTDLRTALEHENESVELAGKRVTAAQARLDKSKREFARLTELKDRHQTLQAAVGKLKAELKALASQECDLRKEIQRIEKSATQLQGLQKERERYFEVKAEKERLENLRLRKQHQTQRLSELAYNQTQLADEEKIITNLKAQLADSPDFEAELAKLESQEKQLQDTERQIRNEEQAQQKAMGAIEAKGRDLKNHRQQLEKLGPNSPCPVCTRPLQEHYDSVIGEIGQSLSRLREAYRKAQQQIQAVQQRLRENKEAQSAVHKMRIRLAEEKTHTSRQRERLREAEARAAKYREKVGSIQQEIDAMGEIPFTEAEYIKVNATFEKLSKVYEHIIKLERDIEQKDNLKARLEQMHRRQGELEQECGALEREVEQLAFSEENYRQARAQYETDHEHLNALRQTLAEAEKARAIVQTRLSETEEALRNAEEQHKKVAGLREQRLYYESLAHHFGRFRLLLAGRLRPLIAARASALLRLTTNGRYSLMELDEEYNIRIVDQGASFPLQRFSGGEQDLANLCLRIAISQVVAERSGKAPVQFIVLDEVFGSQDSQRQNLILEALHHLQSQFRQIFIISHVEAIKEILPVLIQVEMVSAYESRAYML